eukprot:3873604-Amphidinium_carterae.2
MSEQPNWGSFLASGNDSTDVAIDTSPDLGPSALVLASGAERGWSEFLASNSVVGEALVQEDEEENEAAASSVSAVALDLSQWDAPMKRGRGRPSKAFQEFLSEVPAPVLALQQPQYQQKPLQHLTLEVEQKELPHHGSLSQFPVAHELQVPSCKSFLRPQVHGHSLISVSASVLEACVRVAASPNASLDADYEKLLAEYVDSGAEFHHGSVASKALYLGQDRQSLVPKLMRLAAGQVLFCHLQRTLVENCVATYLTNSQLITYLDSVAYDETPMKTRVMDATPLDPLGAGTGKETASTFGPVPSRLLQALSTDASSTKILQMKQCSGMLVDIPGLGLVVLLSESPVPLQVMQHANYAVLRECLNRASCTTLSSSKFLVKSRLVSADRVAYGIKAERCILADRQNDGWRTLSHYCDIHSTARAFHKSYDVLMPEMLSGLIHTALAMRVGGAMSCFRQCLRAEVESKLVIYYGEPSLESSLYRQHVMAMFVSSGANILTNQALLLSLPNGDWRVQDEVQVFLPLGMRQQPVNKTHISKVLTASLLFVLCSKKPSLFVRHRWTGADIAVDEIARLQGIHGLLQPVWKRFVAALGKRNGKAANSDDVAPDPASSSVVPAVQESDSANLLAKSEGDVPDPSLHIASEQVEKQRSSLEHSKDLQAASTLISRGPWSELVLCRLTMQPLTLLLQAQLEVASASYEMEQRACAAEHILSGDVDIDGRAPREYMFTIDAAGCLEATYLEQVHCIMHTPVLWNLVEEKHFNAGFNSWAFQILSRQACLVYVDIAHDHKLYPTCLFQLLKEPAKAPDLASEPKCVMDPWSQDLLQKFPGFQGHGFLATLEAAAALGSSNTSQIEARHAAIRKILMQRSTQTWPL